MDLASVLSYLLVLLACVIAFTIAVGTGSGHSDKALLRYRLSLAFMAIGAVLTMLRLAAPSILSIFLANLLVLIGMSLYVDFLVSGKKLWRACVAVMLPISMAGLSYYLFHVDCFSLRALWVQPYHFTFSLLAGLAILQLGAVHERPLRQRVSAALFLLTALLFALRIVSLWREGACTDTLLTSPLHAVSILSLSVAVLGAHFLLLRKFAFGDRAKS
jgi:hypothetical protein